MSVGLLKCKWCSSERVIRYGGRDKKQLWKCKSCGRYFIFGPKLERKEMPLLFNYSLGYVIGVLLGDGSLSKWRDYHYFDENGRQVSKSKATRIVPRYRYGLQLQVKDKDFAEAFARSLEKVTGRHVLPYTIKYEGITEIAGNQLSKSYTFRGYKVQQTNKKLYKKLKPLLEDRSWIYDANDEVKTGFLRGLFDSDGGISRRKRPRQCPRVHLTNKDRNLLDLVKHLLRKYEIDVKIYPMGPIFRLWIHSKENVKRFYNMVGFSIKRKKDGKDF